MGLLQRGMRKPVTCLMGWRSDEIFMCIARSEKSFSLCLQVPIPMSARAVNNSHTRPTTPKQLAAGLAKAMAKWYLAPSGYNQDPIKTPRCSQIATTHCNE